MFLLSPLLNIWQLPVLPEALSLAEPVARVTPTETAFIERATKQGEFTADKVKASSSVLHQWSLVILTIWFIGVVAVFARLLIGMLSVKRITRRARLAQNHDLVALTQDLSRQLRVPRPVTLLQTDSAAVPMTWGWFRPYILLPGNTDSWSIERQRAVLVHELVHIKRRDCLMQMLGHFACALSWFNPLVWFASRQLRRERELACDDHVLAMGIKPSDYVGHLLDIARSLRSAKLPSIVTITMLHRSEVGNRLQAILDARVRRRVFANSMSFVLIGVMSLVVTPLVMIQPVTASSAAETLLVDLKDSDSQTRESAARWSGLVGDDRVVPALIVALSDKESQVREWAARSLGIRRAKSAVEPLIASLKDKDPQVREASAWSLGRINDRRAVEPLTAALSDENDQVREHAAASLGIINEP